MSHLPAHRIEGLESTSGKPQPVLPIQPRGITSQGMGLRARCNAKLTGKNIGRVYETVDPNSEAKSAGPLSVTPNPPKLALAYRKAHWRKPLVAWSLVPGQVCFDAAGKWVPARGPMQSLGFAFRDVGFRWYGYRFTPRTALKTVSLFGPQSRGAWGRIAVRIGLQDNNKSRKR